MIKAKEWYENNRERALEKRKERYERIKNTDEFKEKARQYYLQNKDEINLRNKKYKEENKDRMKEADRRGHLRRIFGITLEQYDDLLEKQNHSCFICERHKDLFNKKLAVDHDHKTGEIRGLLCVHCNQKVIGRERDPKIFERAAEYLKGPFTGWIVPKKKRKKRQRIRKNSTQVINMIDSEDLE